MGRRAWVTTSSDVSRHGMFLLTEEPPRERFLIKLKVELPEGEMEATAFVSRRDESGSHRGVGIQFFALSAQAKSRWDRFVGQLAGAADAEPRDVSSSLPENSATFLIKLRDVDRMVDFFEKNVRSGHVQMNTPLLRSVGSSVGLIIIHPESEREFLIEATVRRVAAQPTKSMELDLEKVTEKLSSRFYDFVKTGRPSETMDLKVDPGRATIPNEIPNVLPDDLPDEVTASEADETEDIEDDDIPFGFEVDSETGDLSLDIEVADGSGDEHSFDELESGMDDEGYETIADLPTAASSLDSLLEALNLRCTACGTFLGAASARDLPEPLAFVATRRVFYDRYDNELIETVGPLDDDRLARRQAELEGRQVPIAALFQLARHWRESPTAPAGTRDLYPALREAASKVLMTKAPVRIDADCPACGEASLFASSD